ncbi:MAG: glycosyltransferase family 2 protein, partial [Opitutaceae bacterium]|nr:glycosyltransferase family 2 protein [Opitutaceae bacterium]
GRAFLGEAVDSILKQTFTDYELLIINDGSTDDSLQLLQAYRDPRIRLVDQHPNRGIRGSLNRGLHEARGRYLAIMDQDDISAPQRLEKIVERMESQPELAICGSAIETFGDHPVASWVKYFEPTDLKIALLFENPVCHPSVLLRRSLLDAHGLEYPDVPFAEEYSLWVALSRIALLANLPTPLLRYRSHSQQVSRSRTEIQGASMNLVLREQLTHLDLSPTPQELILHKMLGGVFNPLPAYGRRLRHWADRLLAANRKTAIYPIEEFSRQLGERVEATIKLNRDKLRSLNWARRLAWQFSVWRDFQRATHSTPTTS